MIDLNLEFDLLDYEEDDDWLRNEELLNEDFEKDKENDIKGKQCIPKTTAKSFRDLLLKQELLRALNDCGFESPSEVQNECIPQAILGVDILCQAKSGMGKTCVFVLSTLQQLNESDRHIEVLVLVHTRELAFQISREYERFSKYMTASIAVFFGGISQRMDEQVIKFNRPQVVVSTTGRLRALIRDRKIDLSHVKHLVIDECDKMFGLDDYLSDIIFIERALPKDKQVMMFSATMNETTRKCVTRFMVQPLEVTIGDESELVLHGLQQFYSEVTEKDKVRKTYHLLTTIDFKQTIVFTNTIQRCIALFNVLEKLKLSVTCIHSAMTQEKRLIAYQLIKTYKKRVLVATKMFDRGIDFERVNLVINYDFPDNSDTYLHAVGRAGRFGTKGVAVSLIAGHEANRVRNEVQHRFNIKLEELPQKIVI